MKILCCGGRDNWDHEGVTRELDKLHEEYLLERGMNIFIAPFLIITGGANGIDSCALQWAMTRGVKFQVFQADWKRYGKRAPEQRNLDMVTEGKPNLVLCFRGGNGTARIRALAKSSGIEVIDIVG